MNWLQGHGYQKQKEEPPQHVEVSLPFVMDDVAMIEFYSSIVLVR